MAKWVYSFEEGSADMRNLLGGKGANLAEMTNLGLPIPQGFTVTTEACTDYYAKGKQISDEIREQIFTALSQLEEKQGKKFGDTENPLLVSVRSGARASMPGMMDTILNLGLNDVAVEGFAAKTGNPRFAYDSYRRFIQMFSDVVMEIPKSFFERILDEIKESKGVKFDTDLTADDLKEVIVRFKAVYKDKMNEDFPQDPKIQLMEAVKAVFRSWDNERAIVYRRMNDIPGDWGTAVNVQAMVFGNMGNTSGTGVAFTRNPSTGAKGIYGEYLINAQGEDVVAGIRTPQPITKLEEDLPECYAQFIEIANKLEAHYRDMQDMEFTVEHGKLYMLQTRNGKRTAQAALQIACDLVDEGKINPEEAVLRIEAKSLDQLLHPTFDPEALKQGNVIGQALPASPGAAAGKVYFTAHEAKDAHEKGERVILVRLETSPEDIEGMHAAEGILTVRGGMTSHAAVVARGMGTCCVSGCGDISINEEDKVFELGGHVYHEGDYISLDGSTGKIYDGDIKTQEASISGNFGRIMGWADSFRKLKVRTNADTPEDAANAVKYGAEGIGLCRTEHMFFQPDRIPKIRQMILSRTVQEREKALNDLIPYQKGDFKALYEVMEGRPVTIRFLDPPLHEFVPTEQGDIDDLAVKMMMTAEQVQEDLNHLSKDYALYIQTRDDKEEILYGKDFGLTFQFEDADMIAQLIANQKFWKWGINLFPHTRYEISVMADYDKKKLESLIKGLSCMDSKKMVQPEDAYLTYDTDNGIHIVPEIKGSLIKVKAFREQVVEAVENVVSHISLEDLELYEEPKIYQDNQSLNERYNLWKQHLDTQIVYHFDENTEILDATIFYEWMSEDEKGGIVFDKERIQEFVKGLAKKYNTGYSSKEFETSYGETVTIKGGPYG